MQEFLNHPAVQGGLAPFVIALVTAELLLRLRLSGLALIAGFAATVYLVSGISFDPLTSSRKIVLLGLLAAALSIPLVRFKPGWLRPLLSVAGGVLAVWVEFRILRYQDASAMALWGAGSALYVGWLVFWLDTLEEDSVRASTAGLGLGLGTGGAALFGASALLGQFGLSMGAAAGACVLVQMLSNKPLPCGRSFTMPLSIVAGLTGCLAALTAELPWYALPVLGVIPLAAKMPVPERQALWIQSLLLSVVTLVLAAGAVYLTWRVAGAPPI